MIIDYIPTGLHPWLAYAGFGLDTFANFLEGLLTFYTTVPKKVVPVHRKIAEAVR